MGVGVPVQGPHDQPANISVLSNEQFPTQVAVERRLEALVFKLNSDNPVQAVHEPTFGALIDRFVEEERLEEIKKHRPGEQCNHELSYGTMVSCLSVLKRVRARWGLARLSQMRPVGVQEWLRAMDAAPKTKGHIKSLMHRLYEKESCHRAELPCQPNPAGLYPPCRRKARAEGNRLAYVPSHVSLLAGRNGSAPGGCSKS
jgi:hypothetical protein